MKIRLLRFFARRPLALLALGAASILGAAAAIGLAASASGDASDTSDDTPHSHEAQPTTAPVSAQANPRLILGRPWLDSYPQKRTDVLKLYYFGGGGIGIYEDGSSYRYSIDVFDLERNQDKLEIKFLQDGKKHETKFTITPCSDKPQFDLCLDLADSPRGPKRYYSWGDDEEAARNTSELIRAAERAVQQDMNAP